MADIRSADLMVKTLLSDNRLKTQLATDPDETLKEAASEAIRMTPLDTDKFIYRAIVLCLGAVTIIVTGGLIYLATRGGEIKVPDSLVALGSAALGALAGLLAPSPRR